MYISDCLQPSNPPKQGSIRGMIPIAEANTFTPLRLILLDGLDPCLGALYIPPAWQEGEKLYFAVEEGLAIEMGDKPHIVKPNTVIAAHIVRVAAPQLPNSCFTHLVSLRFDILDTETAHTAHASCLTPVALNVCAIPVLLSSRPPAKNEWRIVAPIFSRHSAKTVHLGLRIERDGKSEPYVPAAGGDLNESERCLLSGRW